MISIYTYIIYFELLTAQEQLFNFDFNCQLYGVLGGHPVEQSPLKLKDTKY